SGTRGTKVREPAEPGESGKFVPDSLKANGTSGPRVREPAGSAKMGNFSTVPSGTEGRVGREKPKRPKAEKK
ncbi:hypothetical protein KI387_012220, partial [Taxus chinensis]